MSRRLYLAGPFVLSGAMSALALVQLWAAIGRPGSPGFWIAVGVLAAGHVVSLRRVDPEDPMPLAEERELVGVLALCGGILLGWLIHLARPDAPVAGAEWIAIAAMIPAFCLGSHHSFLLRAALDAFILFVAILMAPSPAAAGLFLMLVLLLFALLNVRIGTETGPTRRRPPVGTWLRGALPMAALFGALFVAVAATRPPTPASEPPRELVWLLTGRFVPRTETVEEPLPPDEPGFASSPSAESGVFPWSGGGPLVEFDSDLKFGDYDTDPLRGEEQFFIVRLTDETGEVLRPGDVDLFWRLGHAVRYENGRWPMETAAQLRVAGPDGIELGPLPERFVDQRIVVLPIRLPGLPSLAPAARIDLPELPVGDGGSMGVGRTYAGPFRYRVLSAPRRPLAWDWETARTAAASPECLGVPDLVAADAAFDAAARQVRADGALPARQLRRLAALMRECEYTTDPEHGAGDPTLEFLRTRRGYCQHFASAAALILRRNGIPTRVVSGFYGGDWDPGAEVLRVKRRHAHAWIEIPIEGFGWVAVDPTEGVPLPEVRESDPVPAPTPTPRPPQPAPHPTPSPQPQPSPEPQPTPEPEPEPQPDPTPDPQPEPPPDLQPPRPVEPILPEPTVPPNPVHPQPVEAPDMFEQMWDSSGDPRTIDSAPSPRAAPGETPALRPPSTPEPPEGGPTATARRDLTWAAARDLAILLAAAAVIALAIRLGRRRSTSRVARGTGGRDPDFELRTASPDQRTRALIRDRLVRLYAKALARLARIGCPRRPGLTAWEYTMEVAARLPGAMHPLNELTRLFVRARYGPISASPNDVTAAQTAYDRLVAAL